MRVTWGRNEDYVNNSNIERGKSMEGNRKETRPYESNHLGKNSKSTEKKGHQSAVDPRPGFTRLTSICCIWRVWQPHIPKYFTNCKIIGTSWNECGSISLLSLAQFLEPFQTTSIAPEKLSIRTLTSDSDIGFRGMRHCLILELSTTLKETANKLSSDVFF